MFTPASAQFAAVGEHLNSQTGRLLKNRERRCGRWAIFGLGGLLMLAATLDSQAQIVSPENFATRSFSGQFIVQVAPGTQFSFAPSNLETNRAFARLDPTLVPVSCERIKQILWREMDIKPPYSGMVFITIYPGSKPEQPIAVDAQQFRDGWQYRVVLPSLVERVRYVRTIVQVLLLELANRAAVDHSAEVPPWLTEGLAQELLASREIEIILPPPNTPANHIRLAYTPVDQRRQNPLEHAHQVLTVATPLTFQQLSWPAFENLGGPGEEIYSSSAQLFVHQLLELRDGGACLRVMLAELPKHYNWQLAFLQAFRTHFMRPLDIEKWWAVEVVNFTGRDLSDAWSGDESWQKLHEAVHPSVQVRTGTNELPLQAEVDLQTIIREWPPASQTPALQNKLRQFESLRLRLAREWVPLLDQYSRAVAAYLENRQHTGFALFRKQPSARQEAIRQLDVLDARLMSLRPSSPPAPVNTRLPAEQTPLPSLQPQGAQPPGANTKKPG